MVAPPNLCFRKSPFHTLPESLISFSHTFKNDSHGMEQVLRKHSKEASLPGRVYYHRPGSGLQAAGLEKS